MFNPTLFGNVIAWIQPGLVPLLAGQTISVVPDRSGNGSDCSSNVGPMMHEDLIGRVARFDGTSQFLAAYFVQNQPATVLVVARCRGPRVANDTLIDGSFINAMRLYRIGANDIAAHAGGGVATVTTTPEQWHVYAAYFDGANSFLQVDQNVPVTGNVGTNTPAGLTLAANGGGTEWGPVDIAEVVLFDGAVTNLAEAITRLADKYGL